MTVTNTRPRWLLCLALTTAFTAGACAGSSSGGTPDDDGGVAPADLRAESADTRPVGPAYTDLRIDPPEAVLNATGDGPVTQQFEAYGTLNGTEQRVTDKVLWVLSDLACAGVVQPGQVVASGRCGGVLELTASSGTSSAKAKLKIRVSRTFVDPAATPPIPTTPPDWFDGTAGSDSTLTPEIVYPLDRVLLPPNLNTMEVQFRRSHKEGLLFEVGLRNELTDVRLYTRCAGAGLDWNGCATQLSGEAWAAVALTNRGGSPVTLTVRAADDTVAAGPFGESTSQTLAFTKDDLKGAVYYWTTSGNTADTAIYRWDFGSAEQTAAEPVITTAATTGDCLGCHALSRDGSKIIASVGTYLDDGGRLLLWDVARAQALQPFPLAERSNFQSWNPDGTAFVGVYGDKGAKGELLLFDGTTGARTGAIPIGELRGDHPDWSLDGQRILFSSIAPDSPNDEQTIMGGIAYVQRSGDAWSAPAVLVPSEPGKNRYYPALAPDNSMVVFNESVCDTADANYHSECDGDSDLSARLFVSRSDDPTPVLLTNANAPGKCDGAGSELTLRNSYAKWSPFVFKLSEQDSVLWATMSSGRRYGMRAPTGYWLWMFAVNPAKAGDPSFPPFWLPFQNIATSNHTAQWTSKVPPPVQ